MTGHYQNAAQGDISRSDLQGYGQSYVPRAKLPPEGRVPLRQLDTVSAQDIELQPMKYLALALIHLRNQLDNLAQQIANKSRPFDEYLPQTPQNISVTSVTLQPAFESTERVETIIITGPAGAVTLQLGDRFWQLTIPASGFLILSPVKVILERSDNRILTSATPGNYTLELMGYADERA
jgi:hypothetical protein